MLYPPPPPVHYVVRSRERLPDYSSCLSFNEAFALARRRHQRCFTFHQQAYRVRLVEAETERIYQQSLEFLALFARAQPRSQVLLRNLYHPVYLSLTNQKPESVAEDGHFRARENRLFIYYEPGNLDSETTPVHELAHKMGCWTRTTLYTHYRLHQYFTLSYQQNRFVTDEQQFRYVAHPGERAARHLAALFWLYRHAGYCPDEQVSLSQARLLLACQQSLPYDIQQLLELYAQSEVLLLRQLNTPMDFFQQDYLSPDPYAPEPLSPFSEAQNLTPEQLYAQNQLSPTPAQRDPATQSPSLKPFPDPRLSFMALDALGFASQLTQNSDRKTQQRRLRQLGNTDFQPVQTQRNPFGNYTPNAGLGPTFQPTQYAPTQRPGYALGGEYQLSEQQLEDLRGQGYAFEQLD